jgi:membrane-associated phospholipid phosphatase
MKGPEDIVSGAKLPPPGAPGSGGPVRFLHRVRNLWKRATGNVTWARAKLYGAVTAAQVSLYFLINYLTKFRTDINTLMTDLDRAIPLIPETSWIYAMLWPFYFLPLFVFRKMRDFTLFVGAYATGLAVTFITYLVYPVEFIRPEGVEVDSASTWLLDLIYKLDNPYNAMPSQHVFIPFVLALAVRRNNKAFGNWLLVAAAMVGLSILTVKQHYIIDFVTGLALAIFSYKLWFDWLRGWLERKGWLKTEEEKLADEVLEGELPLFPLESPAEQMDRIYEASEQTGKAA